MYSKTTEADDSLKVRNRKILETSVIVIISNFLLALMKAVIGLMTHSIAITLDAINNITDAGSSVITIIGTKLAARKADKKHPWGHGRIEYLSSMILGALVFSAGISSFIDSVKNIRNPQTPEYNAISLIIIAICVLVKIVLGKYTVAVGQKINSSSLVNSGKDASMDALISTTTIVAALIFIFLNLSLEAWLGAIISLYIIKAGLEMQFDTISEILGQRVDPEIVRAVQKTVEEFPEVHGVYDMVFHDYGPNRMNGSLHIEVDDTMRADEISDLIRRITGEVYNKHQVILTAIGIYSKNTENEAATQLREDITKIAESFEHVLQIHGFYIKENHVRFDVIVDFEASNREEICNKIASRVQEKYPEYQIQAFLDTDYTFSE